MLAGRDGSEMEQLKLRTGKASPMQIPCPAEEEGLLGLNFIITICKSPPCSAPLLLSLYNKRAPLTRTKRSHHLPVSFICFAREPTYTSFSQKC
jgi:hypothetical protein